jgi:hypothetical protein
MMSVGKLRQGKCQAAGCWIRKERRLAIYMRDGFHCCYCGCDLRGSAAADITLDHLTPRSAGGDNGNTNLVTACRSCNSARGAKVWTDYATGGAVERIGTLRLAAVNVVLAKALIAGTTGDAALEAVR